MYEDRLARHRAEIERLNRRERAFSIARLVTFAIFLLTALKFGWFSLIALGAFLMLVFAHEPVVRKRRRAIAAAKFCERGEARASGDWAGKGDPGKEFLDEHHPFAADLDLFGRGSLFELMSIATTAAGRATLARWLLHPERVTAAEVRERQSAAGELRDRVDLREEIAVVASEVAGAIEGADLQEWIAEPPRVPSASERVAMMVFSVLASLALLLGFAVFLTRLLAITNPGSVQPLSLAFTTPLVIAIFIRSGFASRSRKRTETTIAAVERREPALGLLARLLERLERERFTAPRLVTLRAALERDGTPASKQIERLRGLVALLDARRNQFFAPVAALILWTDHVAVAIERWRAASGHEIVKWIESAGEIEALLSLASFAYEQPAFTTPEIGEGDAHFEAVAAGHPLVAEGKRVTNDLRLGGELRLLIVSGSNMSGKSTLLRTVGINAVLALAGANACATSMKVAPMSIGASISIHDSLAEGASRFYAEILRIREILRMKPPLLFLLDELLHGTNSHDRRIGGEAIVRGLIERGAVGIATTHDLALAEIATSLGTRAANVHFEDHLEEGAVAFDYRMRPGVVTKSNALALMRAVGIEV